MDFLLLFVSLLRATLGERDVDIALHVHSKGTMQARQPGHDSSLARVALHSRALPAMKDASLLEDKGKAEAEDENLGQYKEPPIAMAAPESASLREEEADDQGEDATVAAPETASLLEDEADDKAEDGTPAARGSLQAKPPTTKAEKQERCCCATGWTKEKCDEYDVQNKNDAKMSWLPTSGPETLCCKVKDGECACKVQGWHSKFKVCRSEFKADYTNEALDPCRLNN